MLDKEFIKKMKQRLEDEKKSVEQKLAELNRPEKPMDNPDVDDLANDATEDIIEESTKVAFNDLLDKINSALEKIAAGNYGQCVTDGNEIPREKLEEEPWAANCSHE